MYTVHLSSSLPQRDLQPLTRVSVDWGKQNKETFQGLMDIGSELTPSPEDPKITAPQSDKGLTEDRLPTEL